jgi:uncharacterized protein (DUF2267 family)
MQLHEFLNRVKDHAHLSSKDEAMRASCATLETLGERLKGGEPHDIASQLPEELAACLRHKGSGDGQRFDPDEFMRRVCEREGVDLGAAGDHVRAVFDTLLDALSPGEVEDIRAQLPKEYHGLLQPTGRTTH